MFSCVLNKMGHLKRVCKYCFNYFILQYRINDIQWTMWRGISSRNV